MPIGSVNAPVHRGRLMKFILSLYIRVDKRMFVNRQVRRLSAMAFNEINTDQIGKKRIQKYFCYRRNSESDMMLHFRCYNTCETFLRSNERVFEENEIIAILYSLGRTIEWAQILKTCFDRYQNTLPECRLITALNDLKRTCLYEMEISFDRFRFRRDIASRTAFIRSLIGNIYDDIFQF